jgi:hypothetical protein
MYLFLQNFPPFLCSAWKLHYTTFETSIYIANYYYLLVLNSYFLRFLKCIPIIQSAICCQGWRVRTQRIIAQRSFTLNSLLCTLYRL